MKLYHWLRRQPAWRRAAVAVVTAICLVVLLVFASFSIDLGFVRAVCGDMQHTADGAALAGASALMQSDGQDPDAARARAIDIIERMQASQGFEALEDQIIQLGTWDHQTHTFTLTDPAVTKPFAVRVVSVRNNTPLFFAAILGKDFTNVSRQAVALGSGPCSGVWGLEGVKVIGNVVTDSYDSTTENYSAETANENGDVCSGRNINVNGGVEIHGDAMAGLGYDVIVNGSSGEITGITTSNNSVVTAPTIEFGDVQYVNDNLTIPLTDSGKSPWKGALGWDLFLTANDNVNVAPGNYYFETLTMRSGSSITLSGKTTFYIDGNVDAAGAGIISLTQNPNDLSIISLGAQFDLGGTFDFFGSVLAPYADVALYGDAGFYGAVIGQTVEMKGNFQFHVDESLPLLDFLRPPQPSLVK